MPLASRLGQYIDDNAIQCQQVHHARSRDLIHAVQLAQAIPELTIRAHLLLDRDGPAVLALPFQSTPDLEALNRYSGRSFQLIDDDTASKLFADCDAGHVPFLAHAYGLLTYVDENVLTMEQCFASSGSANTLLRLPSFSIRAAFSSGVVGVFAQAERDEIGELSQGKEYSLDDVARRLTKLYRLPPMPETAVRILHLTADPDSSVHELSDLVEHDPSLAAQIMRYARSALFNYQGDLTCVREAINVVLGFDRVSKLAMGIASAKAFRVPSDGPLGLTAFWSHALHCAVLSQALALVAKPELAMDDREAYLSGLLHNFGLLLVGHLFPPEYRMMNKLRETDPTRSMADIESLVFGMGSAQQFISLGHGSLGAILLKLWGLPDATIKVAGMHQNHSYHGEHENMVNLVQVANYLLSQHGIGDEEVELNIEPMLSRLGISHDQAYALAEMTVDQCRELDEMGKALVA